MIKLNNDALNYQLKINKTMKELLESNKKLLKKF
jgi:hypothetical protein